MRVFPRRKWFWDKEEVFSIKVKLLEEIGTSWTIRTLGKSVSFMETLCDSEHWARNDNRRAGGSNRREEFENSRNRSLSSFNPSGVLFPRAPIVVWLYYITGIKAWPPFTRSSGFLGFIYPIPVDLTSFCKVNFYTTRRLRWFPWGCLPNTFHWLKWNLSQNPVQPFGKVSGLKLLAGESFAYRSNQDTKIKEHQLVQILPLVISYVSLLCGLRIMCLVYWQGSSLLLSAWKNSMVLWDNV